MAQGGKVFQFAGMHVQLDPLVLLRRVITHQKRFLIICALVGGTITAGSYATAPKIYTATSTTAIRIENLRQDYVRKLANRAFQSLHSDLEMMTMINELHLYPAARATRPYEFALRRLRRELSVDREHGSINISFESEDPVQAQQVVAYVTERALGKIADLLDSPHRRTIEALNGGIRDLETRLKVANTKLFEFKAKHPSIAIRTPDYIRPTSPMAGIEDQINRAERALQGCYAGDTTTLDALRTPEGPACQALGRLQNQRDDLLKQFTSSHPSVTAINRKLIDAQGPCNQENQRNAQPSGGMTKDQCIQKAQAAIHALQVKKVNLEKRSIRRPALQREWADLSLQVNQIDSDLRQATNRRGRVQQDRLVDLNRFQENFQLVDPARVPDVPSKPVKPKYAATGMFVTAVIGLFVAVLLEALRQTFTHPEELEQQSGLSVFAEFPPL